MSDELFPISLADQIGCIERELALRRRVYGRMVEQGRMTAHKAQREIELMASILDTLNRLKGSAIPEWR